MVRCFGGGGVGADDDINPEGYAAELGRDDRAQAPSGAVAGHGVTDSPGDDKTDAGREARTRIGPVGMHDEESSACSAGAWSTNCRREVRPRAQTVTCRYGLHGVASTPATAIRPGAPG